MSDGGDAGGADATPPVADGGNADAGIQYGAQISNSATAELAALDGDETTLFFYDSGRVFSVKASGTAQAVDRGPRPSAIFTGPSGVYAWVLDGTGVLGALPSTGTSTARFVMSGVLKDTVAIGLDSDLALAGARPAGSATAAFDLFALHASGMNRTRVMSGLLPGSGCETKTLFVNPFRAMVAACVFTPVRALFFVDLEIGSSRLVSSDAGDLVRGSDRSFILFLDSQHHLHATDVAGARVAQLMEAEAITQVLALEGRRFAYRTASGAIRAAVYPDLNPVTLYAGPVDGMVAASPDGKALVLYQGAAPDGLLRLLALPTTSTTPAFPLTSAATGRISGDAFSSDGAFVLYLDGAEGDSRRADGTGTKVQLSTRARALYALSGPASVLIFDGSHIADLVVRAVDGSGDRALLVPGIDADQALLFPKSKAKIAFRVSADSSHAGLYLRDLPGG